MKLTVLLTFLVFATFGNSFSQVTLSLHFKKANIHDVLGSIEKKTGYIFLYKDDVLNDAKEISVDFMDAKFDEVLKSVCEQSNVDYEVREQQVILKEKANFPIPTDQLQPRKKEISGTVKDSKGLPLPGATVFIKGTTVGTITDNDGIFKLDVPIDSKTLSISFVGMKSIEIAIGNENNFNIALEEQTVGVDEVVVVGYGTQKKESIVGSITQTTGDKLEQSGGVTNMAQALTGLLPGVTTIQTTGEPGQENPIIYIRGQSSWNGGQPLVLVDGIERSMNNLDMSEVASVSVLKDASATAIFGVKGANGVILITTKRGKTGKPRLSVSGNSTMKIPSRLPDKKGSYDAIMVRNKAIEREALISGLSWGDYIPYDIAKNYLNPPTGLEEAYPDINWRDWMFNDFAMSYRTNVNVSGGTDFAKYFATVAYLNEGDLIKPYDNGKGYSPKYGYNRFNFRSNLDFNLTRSTKFSMNLAGFYGVKSQTNVFRENYLWRAAYINPPDVFLPQYADGTFGYYAPSELIVLNSVSQMVNSGVLQTHNIQLNTDFSLEQKLDFITKNLSFKARLSYDNTMQSSSGINDNQANAYQKYISPYIVSVPAGGDTSPYIYYSPTTGFNQFGFIPSPWTTNNESLDQSQLIRTLYYEGQVNYVREFGRHDISAMGMFSRQEYARGNEFIHYREDWVFRATYNFDKRYFLEINGAYNGSEQFGPGYRFDFFPSLAAGWQLANEPFLKRKWLNNLKFRGSYGLVGDDKLQAQRWLYATQWQYERSAALGTGFTDRSPYIWYREKTIGNPDIHWETAEKIDAAVDFGLFGNTFTGSFDYFRENRNDILIDGNSRTVPAYFGGTPPSANLGKVEVKGYELELGYDKRTTKGLRYWATFNMTHAKDEVIYKDDPPLLDDYLKASGYQIGQSRTQITNGFYNSWDEVLSSTQMEKNDQEKIPGFYYLLDFNGDGRINGFDYIPYGYPERPQNSFNFSFGADFKGFSFMLQFYGVNNVTRQVNLQQLVSGLDNVYELGDYWSADNQNASTFFPGWNTNANSIGNYFFFDASYLRLKNAEIAYTFTNGWIKKARMASLKLYVNGNNLFFWSDLPDDRESAADATENEGTAGMGSYPTSKRFNFGVDINF